MPPSPNSQSLTSFLIWAGAFLVVAAFVVPSFVLRDTGVLTIPQADLARLTPTAEEELKRRQAIARDAGEVAPDIGLAFFIAGVVLLVIGIPRLRQQEQGDEERRKMERDKLDRELRPQSPTEKSERLQRDVGETEEPGPSAPPSEPPSPPEGSSRRMAEQINRAADVEDAVLRQLAALAPPRYELEPQVAVEGRWRLLLDGLLISEIDQLPDIVVEIKYFSRASAEVMRRVREGKMQLLSHMARYGRPSIGWLIIVTPELPPRKLEMEQVVASADDDVYLSIVTLDTLDQLKLPI